MVGQLEERIGSNLAGIGHDDLHSAALLGRSGEDVELPANRCTTAARRLQLLLDVPQLCLQLAYGGR